MEFMDNTAYWCDDLEGVNFVKDKDNEIILSIEFSNDSEINLSLTRKDAEYLVERINKSFKAKLEGN